MASCSSYAIMIKLLYCVDDTVLLTKSVFSEMKQGYERMLQSNRVGPFRLLHS